MRFTRGPRPQEHDPKEGSLTRSCEKTKRPREKLERVKGIEPSYSAWKAAALPLSYTREAGVSPASGRAMRGDSRGAKVIRQVRAPSKRRAPASSDCLVPAPRWPAARRRFLCVGRRRGLYHPGVGAMLPFWRLDPPFRFAICSAFAALFASGAAWLVANSLKRDFQRRNLAAGRRLSTHGPWRCRDADVDAARRPLPASHWPRLARQEKPRHRHRHVHVQRVAHRNRLRALLSRLGNFAAMGERSAYCLGLVMPLLSLAHIKTGRKRA